MARRQPPMHVGQPTPVGKDDLIMPRKKLHDLLALVYGYGMGTGRLGDGLVFSDHPDCKQIKALLGL